MGLVYRVRLTLTSDVTYAIDAVGMWAYVTPSISRSSRELTRPSRTTEFTTVMLASAFPTMPRLLQWIRDRNKSPSQLQAHQRPSRPSYPEHSTRSDVEAGGPWDGSGSRTAILSDNYIRLEEQSREVGQNSQSPLQREPLAYPFNSRAQDTQGIMKTIRVETN